jgi:hypothetical protein
VTFEEFFSKDGMLGILVPKGGIWVKKLKYEH